MSPEPVPVPAFLPVLHPDALAALPELTLELYRRVADSAREAEEQSQKAAKQIEQHAREVGRTLARLAAVRFELGRVLHRVMPALAEAGREDLSKVLDLFARGWDAELARAEVEVRDPAGERLTDELAAVIEVEAAVPDPAASHAMVRETLSPLVLWAGRVIGTARVITSVPAVEAIGSGLALGLEEES